MNKQCLTLKSEKQCCSKFEVLTAVSMAIKVSENATQNGFVKGYHVSEKPAASILSAAHSSGTLALISRIRGLNGLRQVTYDTV
jgi:hypothetical protein